MLAPEHAGQLMKKTEFAYYLPICDQLAPLFDSQLCAAFPLCLESLVLLVKSSFFVRTVLASIFSFCQSVKDDSTTLLLVARVISSNESSHFQKAYCGYSLKSEGIMEYITASCTLP